MSQGRVYIGTSGWNYRDWRGRFYPQGLRQSDWRKHFAGQFDSVEVNNALLDSENVDVRVANGVVTLTGTVPSGAGYRAAMDAALYTAGVVDVHDNLTVAV